MLSPLTCEVDGGDHAKVPIQLDSPHGLYDLPPASEFRRTQDIAPCTSKFNNICWNPQMINLPTSLGTVGYQTAHISLSIRRQQELLELGSTSFDLT
jgi:hypothetical protein